MRAATFNVLADAYLSYGDYTHVDPELLLPHARTEGIMRLVDDLGADVVGIQEADEYLRDAFKETANWQVLWSQKERGKPDGCLTLVRADVAISSFDTYAYSDGSGHILQAVRIGQAVFANTHIKWAPDTSPDHVGVAQTSELLKVLEGEQSAVIFADCNDRPNGPVRKLVENAGFINVSDDEPTAIVNAVPVALDLLAIRGMTARRITRSYDLRTIPNRDCPSDHIPLVAELEIN